MVKSIHKLKVQQAKLRHVTFRLQQRDKMLFKTCINAVKNKNKEKAVICANEIAEVRKLIKFLNQVELALERVILRLETIKELSEIVVELKPALKILKNVTNQLSQVLPDVAYELESVSESISETLATTSFRSSPESLVPLQMKTPGGEEILKEVSAFLEEKVAEKLPEPPASPTLEKKPELKTKTGEMIALTAIACSSSAKEKTEKFGRITSYQDVELQKLSMKIQKDAATQELEKMVLEYIKRKDGQLDLTECALDLKVPSSEIEEILKNLGEKGKVRIYVK